MNIITNTEYNKRIIEFIQNHGGLRMVTTSQLHDNKYQKEYTCEDGEQITEVNRKVCRTEEAEIMIGGVIPFTKSIQIEVFESEMWNTVDGKSVYTYQVY